MPWSRDGVAAIKHGMPHRVLGVVPSVPDDAPRLEDEPLGGTPLAVSDNGVSGVILGAVAHALGPDFAKGQRKSRVGPIGGASRGIWPHGPSVVAFVCTDR